MTIPERQGASSSPRLNSEGPRRGRRSRLNATAPPAAQAACNGVRQGSRKASPPIAKCTALRAASPFVGTGPSRLHGPDGLLRSQRLERPAKPLAEGRDSIAELADGPVARIGPVK